MAFPLDVTFLVPGALDSLTGGSIYDRRIVTGLRARGWQVTVAELDTTFPSPTRSAIAAADRVFAECSTGSIAVVDGLVFGAVPETVNRAADRLKLVAIIHLPLAMAWGLEASTRACLEESERRALAVASLVIVTGQRTVDVVTGYGVPADRVVCVSPGIDRAPVSKGSQGNRVELLSVANLVPGKGHRVLVDALAGITDRSWNLTCVGSLERDAEFAREIQAEVRARGLQDRIVFTGALDEAELAAHYNRADVFVLPTLLETYGMAVADALAHGLPVISTTTGAIPELVGDRAGLIVAPGDTLALRGALALVMDDRQVRRRFTAGARQVRGQLRSWDTSVEKFASALGQLADV